MTRTDDDKGQLIQNMARYVEELGGKWQKARQEAEDWRRGAMEMFEAAPQEYTAFTIRCAQWLDCPPEYEDEREGYLGRILDAYVSIPDEGYQRTAARVAE